MFARIDTKQLLAGLCIILVALTACAANPSTSIPAPPVSSSTLIPRDDVNLQKIKAVFDTAFIQADFDKDGDLKIEDGGIRSYIKMDKDKKLITLFAMWNMKESVPEINKLRFINSLNDKLIFVRFSMPKPTILWCEYQFTYEGGIMPHTLVTGYRIFINVIKSAVTTKDPESIVGSDPK